MTGERDPTSLFIVVALVGGAVSVSASERMLASFGAALGTPITILALIGLGLLVALDLALLHASSRLNHRLKQAHGVVAKLPLNPNGPTRRDLETLKEWLPRDSVVFAERWDKFFNSLVRRGDHFANTEQSIAFFEDDLLEETKLHRWPGSYLSLARILPGLMVSVGMLGTFGGIALGLGELRAEGMDIGQQVGGVVRGLASAFWTSIFGLISSMIFNWLNVRAFNQLKSALVQLRFEIDRLVPKLTVQRLLHDGFSILQEEVSDGRASLQTLANDLVHALDERLVPELSRLCASVETRTAEAGDAAREASQAFVEELTGELVGNLQGSFASMTDAVTGFNTDFGALMGNVTETVARQEQMLQQAASVQEGLMEVARGFIEAMEKAAAASAALHESTTVLQQQSLRLDVSLDHQLETANVLQAAATRMKNELGLQVAALGAAAQQLSLVGQSTQRWADGANRAMETFGRQLNETVNGSLRRYDESLASAVSSLSCAMGQLEELADQIAHAVERRR